MVLVAKQRYFAMPGLPLRGLNVTRLVELSGLMADCLSPHTLSAPLVQPLRIAGQVPVVRFDLVVPLPQRFSATTVPRRRAQDAGNRCEHLRVSGGLKVAENRCCQSWPSALPGRVASAKARERRCHLTLQEAHDSNPVDAYHDRAPRLAVPNKPIR